MSIALVTDSTADLPAVLRERYDISVVPLEVHLGDEMFSDGVDLNDLELFRRVESGGLTPKTSQPPPGAFVRIYRDLLTRAGSVISIHLSSNLSGTYESAMMARESLPQADITVIDSGQISLGLGLQVLRAAETIRGGAGKDSVLRLLNETRNKAELFVSLFTLDYLRRGGRITKVAHLLGSALHFLPLLRVFRGGIAAVAKSRRRDQAISTLIARLAPLAREGRAILGIAHTAAAAEAEELKHRLQSALGHLEILVQEAGPVLGVHVGPGALAVAVLPI